MDISTDPAARPLAAGRRSLRTPRSAGLAGIAFAVLLTIALLAIRVALPAKPADSADILMTSPEREMLLIGLALVPLAAVAFLWFVGVTRDRIGEREDRFFQTLFLGSALVFVAMLLAAEAIATGLVLSLQVGPETFGSTAPDWWRVGRNICSQLVDGGLQMAGVFTMAASTIVLRTGAAPRWLGASGVLVAVLLFVAILYSSWTGLLFPLWVAALSIDTLVLVRRGTGS